MNLYLMQHGQAVPEEKDPNRPLSQEGIAQIKASAAAMKRMKIKLDLIICSSKKRSFQTAALVAEGVNYPYSDIVKTDSVKATVSAQESIAFLKKHEECESVLIAGHLPSIAEIASALLTDASKIAIRFDNGGLCRIDLPGLPTIQGELVYYLPAAQMRLLGERS